MCNTVEIYLTVFSDIQAIAIGLCLSRIAGSFDLIFSLSWHIFPRPRHGRHVIYICIPILYNNIGVPSALLGPVVCWCRPLNFPGRRTHRLEQPAGQRDICPVSVNFPSAFKNISVPGLVP